jgi:DNA-binding MarR family transcriptional regulator
MNHDNGRTLQLLHRVVLPLDRALQVADRKAGCSAAQLSALGVIIYLKVTTLSALAARERISVPTASRIIDSLVRSGLVTREIDAADRRSVHLRATERGRAAVEMACNAREAVLAETLAGLSDEEWQMLGGTARALVRVFGYDRVSEEGGSVGLNAKASAQFRT